MHWAIYQNSFVYIEFEQSRYNKFAFWEKINILLNISVGLGG